jgi:hypothetical protein
MNDFEKEIRAAFERGPEGAPTPTGLRDRMIARAVSTPRARGRMRPAFSFRSLPSLAAVSAVLAAVVIVGSLYLGGHRGITTPRPTAPALAFGQLPAPGLQLPKGGIGGGSGAPPTAVAYFGPAQLTWTGQLPKAPAAAFVYAFRLPGPEQADALASQLGARPSPNSPGSTAREYQGPDGYQLIVIFATWPEQQPIYRLDRAPGPTTSPPPNAVQARAAADTELQRLALTPPWPNDVSVEAWGTPADHMQRVFYQRQFAVGSATAPLVDALGEPGGAAVIVDAGGRTIDLSGPLDAGGEQTAQYPLRSGADAAKAARAASPLSSTGFPDGSVPVVGLTNARMVYAIAANSASGQSYIEPAYIFTGTFVKDRITYEKRVLVPALAAAAIRP